MTQPSRSKTESRECALCLRPTRRKAVKTWPLGTEVVLCARCAKESPGV